ncbi:YgaP family membrane protein [Salinithrix halophila]|uniref:DUF2892 domain-containing protein n=1 Tax=Salinithrix halophila TaxID=1485204 RepID=A0ABV8J9P6_9BACL
MQKNVGTLDALLRITLGTAGLAWSASKLMRRPGNSIALMMALISGMKIAEGITRFCPLLFAIGVTTRDTDLTKMSDPDPDPDPLYGYRP